MEKLAELPPAALITFGAVLAVIFAVQRLGLWQGQKSTPATDKAQVAAVIVDPSALNRLTEEVGKLVAAVRNLVEVGEEMTKTETHMAIELDRIREELRIQREISRRG
ncbi:hypothetical protein [Shinella zoogloeoides]|uniref:hypothetical protein n=1 Tax=Shinella zoogloeoides TaxID=352475 RepID=UPI00299E8A58|nr:hypothetical protein [Shinella zoogloeoides]WPE22519.1 hypothetical protein ShzoTeo12_37350 [Shinella zoogloeoides]